MFLNLRFQCRISPDSEIFAFSNSTQNICSLGNFDLDKISCRYRPISAPLQGKLVLLYGQPPYPPHETYNIQPMMLRQLQLISQSVSHQFCAINNEIWNRGSRNSFARESPVSAIFVLYVCIAIPLLVCCEGRTVVAPRASCFLTISHREDLFPL